MTDQLTNADLPSSVRVSELIESAMYLFRATGDHTYLQLGLDALESIEKIAKTPCGYASVSPTISLIGSPQLSV